MNLTEYITSKPFVKLSKPQMNLLAKLDAMGVEVVSFTGEDRIITNPVNGYSEAVNPFIAALVNWVYKTYKNYDGLPGGNGLQFGGTPVAIGTFDRVRMLILSIDSEAYSNFID